MSMKGMKRYSHIGIAILFAGLVGVALSTTTSAERLRYIIAANQQNDGERSTATTAGAGGSVKYSKAFFNPGERLIVTFNAQGDTHDGAALLMSCRYTGPGGFVDTPCELGFGAATGAEWSTLNKLPTNPDGLNNNCKDGSAGTADCHDNTIHKVWCMHTTPGAASIDLRLASDNGGTVFYERATILIEGSRWDSNIVCANPGAPAGSGLP